MTVIERVALCGYAYSDIILLRTVIFLSARYDRIGIAGGAGRAYAPFRDENSKILGYIWGEEAEFRGYSQCISCTLNVT